MMKNVRENGTPDPGPKSSNWLSLQNLAHIQEAHLEIKMKLYKIENSNTGIELQTIT